MNPDEPQPTGGEVRAYVTAFETIQAELSKLERIKTDLNRLKIVRWEKPNPKPCGSVTKPDGKAWTAYANLLTLRQTQILLCREAEEWAVIQRLDSTSAYAQAHGEAEILLKGNNPRAVVTEYLAQTNHTLKFMARNLVAHAQKVVWEQFPGHNPSLVVRALSEHCAQAVEDNQIVAPTHNQTERQSPGIKI